MKRILAGCCLLLCGCASTQLTLNVLDVASSTSRLAREQVLYNLAQFIDSDAAIPAQVLFGQGSVSTSNSLSAALTDPISKSVQTTEQVAKSVSTVSSIVGTNAAKSLSLTGGNTGNQSWGIDTVGDPDILRRLYDLYRFAVLGNDSLDAQMALLNDYPIHYTVTSTAAVGPASLTVDPNSIIGSNCVLCGQYSASASPSPPYPKVCSSGNALAANARALTRSSSNALTSYRVELRDFAKPPPGAPSSTSRAATTAATGAGGVCLTINRRLLPRQTGQSRWLLWDGLPGVGRGSSNPPPNPDRDIFLGRYGAYALYVDGSQPERFSEFVIFITAAAASTPNPSTNGASTGSGQPKAPAGTTLLSGQ